MNIGKILKEEIERLVELSIKSPFKGQYILYHSTSYSSCMDIINQNEIFEASKQNIKFKYSSNNPNFNQNSKNYSGVSLTRNSEHEFNDVQLILNGEAIKRDFGKRLMPFDFHSYSNMGKGNPKRILFEEEEFLIGPLTNVKKYLIGIRIMNVYTTLENFIEEDPEGYNMFSEIVNQLNVPFFDKKFNKIGLNALALNESKLYQEEKDSTFTHDDVEYSVNKLLKETKDMEAEDYEVSKLKWILKHTDIDDDRVKEAKLKYPIIIIKWEDKLVVLDGAHRLQKAVDQKKETIKAIKITKKILDKTKL